MGTITNLMKRAFGAKPAEPAEPAEAAEQHDLVEVLSRFPQTWQGRALGWNERVSMSRAEYEQARDRFVAPGDQQPAAVAGSRAISELQARRGATDRERAARVNEENLRDARAYQEQQRLEEARALVAAEDQRLAKEQAHAQRVEEARALLARHAAEQDRAKAG